MNQQIRHPLLTWEKPCRSDICTELKSRKIPPMQRRQHRINPPYQHPRRRILEHSISHLRNR
jgi:hypothetical protein